MPRPEGKAAQAAVALPEVCLGQARKSFSIHFWAGVSQRRGAERGCYPAASLLSARPPPTCDVGQKGQKTHQEPHKGAPPANCVCGTQGLCFWAPTRPAQEAFPHVDKHFQLC